MAPEKLFKLSVTTAIGRFNLLASDRGLRAVCWPGRKLPPKARVYPAGRAPVRLRRMLENTGRQLSDYFRHPGRAVRFTGPLDLQSLTPFAWKVLRSLAGLSYGGTTTYGELASRAGSPNAARAVGTILARNPLPIIIPCHRVLSSRGTLGGFSAPGGLATKRRLLFLENVLSPD